MNILIGSDHAGYMLKNKIKEYLTTQRSYTILDVGCFNQNSCDYPIIADKLCTELTLHDVGILICGTGIGMSIKANRYKSIRCALCHNVETAELGRKHNNTNILALGSRIINNDGNDITLHRLRSASIGEQIKLIRYSMDEKFEK